MQPIRVYCDSGGYRKELADLERRGLLIVTTYAYENSIRKIRSRAPGSDPTWDEGDSTWESTEGTWNDEGRKSPYWEGILRLVGQSNERDAKHLDSAIMDGCSTFLTSDFDDFASKSHLIFDLTGLHVFHATKDCEKFLQHVQSAA